MICFGDIVVVKMFSVDGCFNSYCFSSIKHHVEVELKNGMVASYPHKGCNFKLTMHNCAKFLDPKLVETMNNHKKEASIVVLEKVYYTFLRCSALMSRIEVL